MAGTVFDGLVIAPMGGDIVLVACRICRTVFAWEVTKDLGEVLLTPEPPDECPICFKSKPRDD